jgi:prolyl oligopeptidase
MNIPYRHLAGMILAVALLCAARARADEDSFRYLETPRAPDALTWARTQTQATREAFGALPDAAAIGDELKSVLKAHETPPTYSLLGKRMLRIRRDSEHPYGILEVSMRDADGAPGAWRTALDVGELRRREGKPYALHIYDAGTICLEEIGRCILELSPGGGDAVELREFDLETGAFVDGGYRVDTATRTQVAWLDADHVLIGTAQAGEALTKAGWPAQFRLWRRGTALSAAGTVFIAPSSDAIVQVSAQGEGSNRRAIACELIDYSHARFSVIDRQGRTSAVNLPQTLKSIGAAIATEHQLVVQLGESATIEGTTYPAESLIAYNLDAAAGARRVSLIFRPQGGDVLNDFARGLRATRARVWFTVENHLRKRLVVASEAASGWRIDSRPPAAPGEDLTVAASDTASDDILLGQEGFLTPLRLDLVSAAGATRPIYAESPAFDASGLTVDIRHARSADGTIVDYYLVRPVKPRHPGRTPTLMTGYGAFGISEAPSYLGGPLGGPSLELWYKRGGALALPIIRGGGERGEAWHRSAMREHRQRSYDDFIAVAKDLEAGFTRPENLGVFGSSNGGLLAATVGVQRPELFGAVVSDVPLTDMLRFPEMGMGAAWEDEYGDPADPDARRALLGYSPYQNVKAGVRYPPFLLTVSTEDQRVGPGHARKLAARLLAVGAPAHYYEDEEGGHGVTDALQRPDLVALRMTFLIDTLGLGKSGG